MSMMQQLINRLTALEHDMERLRTIDNPLQLLPFGTFLSTPFPFAASVNAYYPFAVALPRSGVVNTFAYSFYVATTNNASNYWTITLETIGGASVQALTTAGSSANTWTRTGTSFEYSIALSAVALAVKVQSTGAPGDIYLAGPIVGLR